jgi:hypothetical protein
MFYALSRIHNTMSHVIKSNLINRYKAPNAKYDVKEFSVSCRFAHARGIRPHA